MKVAVIGVGHVGLVTAATLARFGHDVVGLDEDSAKIDSLKRGEAPFYEPGLQELLDEVVASGKLNFTRDASVALDRADCAFICVGTPARADGEANLLAVENAARAVASNATGDLVVIQKSTVPVSTADRLRSIFAKTTSHRVRLVSSPEFLREGAAVEDSLKPDRILVGSDDPEAHDLMRELYASVLDGDCRYFATDISTAELAKHACNAFLALKISFANALARVCEASGADVVSVADIMGSDHRIGREFLNAGLGYGGYCFPKDLLAFRAVAGRLGYDFGLLEEVMKINREALDSTLRKIKDAVWNVESKRILLLGLSFKPGTDDVRESPALNLARELAAAGAVVVGHDPQANEAARRELPGLEVVDDPYEGAEGAHCIVVCTDWPQFRDLDLVRLKGIVTLPIIVDGRNLLDSDRVVEAGFSYIPTGRPPANL
ncbi:MAG TPA: UDP-glucose/GDP-mannose dehydrogenase family protein [Actinomycetota bacterium]|nr:UDP-glucose/GDP-mannose dehydrogenase family protein [Actinomycetota bacterium]